MNPYWTNQHSLLINYFLLRYHLAQYCLTFKNHKYVNSRPLVYTSEAPTLTFY